MNCRLQPIGASHQVSSTQVQQQVYTLFLRLPRHSRSDAAIFLNVGNISGRDQIKADMVTYTSDRFEEFKEYALGMIDKGEAYMDDTPQVGRSTEHGSRSSNEGPSVFSLLFGP